ncbi:MAG TPA: tetratricopeptide repeat protein [Burkholderiales bacterium]|nr:tetratricopeptide repeat protein [Burkholderiales bacterium]
MKKLLSGFAGVLMLVGLFAAAPAFAAEPTVHEIYQAADAGRMDEAQRMMREVLQAHPQSGKAHYIDAELLAKQGKVHEAAGELATAEKLAPGLPFAKPEAVTKLRAIIERPAATTPRAESRNDASSYQEAASPQAASFPWGLAAAGIGLVLFIIWAAKFMTRRAPPSGYGGYGPAYGAGPGSGPSPAPYGGPAPGYGPPGYAPAGPAPGMGSQILGGLATGAAVGTGVVLAEELAHRVFDHHGSSSQGFGNSGYVPFQSIPDAAADDMGGNDFGVSDNSSWDDGGSGGGGGDWN